MRKITLLFALLLAGLTYAQTPIITMIADGDESGGTPKVLEIYANGAVDFTQYSLENQTNAHTDWGNTFDLSPLGTVTDDFVYIYFEGTGGNANPGIFAQNYPSATNTLDATSSNVLNINGDDRVRIIQTSTSAVIDIYGQDGVDGTGTAWEYKDGYSKRVNGTGPDPVFVEANWTYNNGALNTHGAVQDGTTYESIIGIGTYTPPTTANPSLVITSPTAGEVFSPVTTDVDVVFTVQNFNVANGTGDGHIQWTLDGGTATDKYDTNPINVTGLTAGNHTVDMKLVDNSNNDLTPAVSASVTFEIASYTQVSTLADLRAGNVGDYYHLTEEVFVTGGKQVGNSFIGYAQNATDGIAAFLPSSVTVATQPNIYDGITDIKGKLNLYHGVLQIILTEDFTVTGNNQPQTAQVVTLADYLANHDDYESELIKFENVTIDPGSDTDFQSSSNYDVTDGTDTVILRTNFPDLVGETIPTSNVDITGIGAEYNGTAQIFPRAINDIENANAIGQNQIAGFKVYPNPVTNNQVFVSSNNNVDKQVFIYDTLGKLVISTEVNNSQAIFVGQLKEGIYLIKVVENNRISVQQLIIK